MTNINLSNPEKIISQLLKAIQPIARIQILLGIGQGEACVCHLEALLGYRQAYISQHLMALRESGILKTRREGRFIYYQLANAELLALIYQAGTIAGISEADLLAQTNTQALRQCDCPHCNE